MDPRGRRIGHSDRAGAIGVRAVWVWTEDLCGEITGVCGDDDYPGEDGAGTGYEA